ncbi:TolC family outer membrane protein [Vibrio sp. DNF-1]|nr:TolC family outer membrane protein [Vibrio salinus]MCE0496310.1 TolC family outer membrane protein [Vibrio salinus]
MATLTSFQVFSHTLEQAIALTLSSNPELRSSFSQYQSRIHDVDSAEGAYLPSVDLSAGIGYEGIDPASSNSKESTDLTRKEATISLSQLIWDGASTTNNIHRTQSEAESDRYQLLADASDMALKVAKIYLDTYQAKEVLALSEDNLAIHKKIYADIKRKAELGLGSTADVSQVEARIAKAEANVLAAQNNYFDSQSEYERYVGEAPSHLIYPEVDMKPMPDKLKNAVKIAFKQNPTIKVAQFDVVAAKYQYKQSKAPTMPTFSIEASHSLRDDAGGYVGGSSETTAMLRMNYNLYKGGSDLADIKSNAYKLNKAKDLREDTFRQVKAGLSLSWNSLEFTKKQMNYLSQHVDTVSDTVIAYQKQYQIGQRTLLDLLNSQNELFEARKDYLSAKYSHQYAKYRVYNALGNLLNILRINIPQKWTVSEVE